MGEGIKRKNGFKAKTAATESAAPPKVKECGGEPRYSLTQEVDDGEDWLRVEVCETD